MPNSLLPILTQAKRCRKVCEQHLESHTLTVLSDWELWACARQHISQYGDGAVEAAALRADALLEAGDLDGMNAWLAIRDRIVALQGRVDSETAH